MLTTRLPCKRAARAGVKGLKKQKNNWLSPVGRTAVLSECNLPPRGLHVAYKRVPRVRGEMQGNVKISQGRTAKSPISAVGRSMGWLRQVAPKGPAAETKSAKVPERLTQGHGRGTAVARFIPNLLIAVKAGISRRSLRSAIIQNGQRNQHQHENRKYLQQCAERVAPEVRRYHGAGGEIDSSECHAGNQPNPACRSDRDCAADNNIRDTARSDECVRSVRSNSATRQNGGCRVE